ncbi:MAG: phosphatidylcholine/phosphatidylserine synthase [Hyphomicrobiaceae bacterium]
MAAKIAAASVHLFTALGAVAALLAMQAVLAKDWGGVFVWLGVAFFIDGVDGFFARLVGVSRVLPRFSGDRLDLVVDYVTYVFVPVLALMEAGFLTGWPGFVVAGLMLLSSLYHFSDQESKSDDHCFVGFPAVWNIVAFYLFAFAAGPVMTYGTVLLCVVLTFVPLRWVHPLRVKALRPVTVALTLAWSAAAAHSLWSGFPASPVAQVILAAVLLYGCGLSLVWYNR